MSLFRFESVRSKLLAAVMLTTLAALVVALAASVIEGLRSYHQGLVSDMATQSELLGHMTAPALAFDDPQLAQQNLNLLRLRPKVHAAAIYDAKGHLFATYSVPDRPYRFPDVPDSEGVSIDGRSLTIFKPISSEGELLGTVYLRADYEFMDRMLTQMGIALFVIAIAMLVAYFLSIRLRRAVSDPIQSIASIAHEVVALQDYSRRAHKISNDEVGELVDSFNNMLSVIERRTQELESSNEKILHLNTALEARVRERTAQLEATNAELATAKVAAEQASQAKSTFLSNMSHELRTPLNAILGFAQLLQSQPNDLAPEKVETYTSHILKAGDHLLVLINEILDLAKIESGAVSLSMEPVSMAELFQGCQLLVGPMAEKRRIALEFPAHASCFVYADRTRLKQVLLNLLSNAIKYNREAGKVEVRLSDAADSCIRISVHDTGAGLTAAQVEQLFQPFNRLGQEAGTEEGTGIGLVVTQRLIQLMGGRLGVNSTPGRGSEFWIELSGVDGVHAAEPPEVRAGSRPQPAAGGATRHVVLYVEDNPVNLRLVEEMMGLRPDVHLLTAADGSLGIELARAHRPDVILLDINLPGMSGTEVLKFLQQNEDTREIPVIAVSANAMPKDIERGLALGFFRYLTKPIRVMELLGMLDEALVLSDRQHRT
jgi:signal transduction histidine kinase/ActR/RegA family two-component response regulator